MLILTKAVCVPRTRWRLHHQGRKACVANIRAVYLTRSAKYQERAGGSRKRAASRGYLVAGEFKRCRDMATTSFRTNTRRTCGRASLRRADRACVASPCVAAAHRQANLGLRDQLPRHRACNRSLRRRRRSQHATVDFLSSSHPRELDYTWYCEQMRRSLETVLKLAGASDADVRAAMKMPDTVVRAESDKSAIDAFCSGRRGRIVHRKRHRDASPAPQGMGAKKQMLIATFFT